MKTLNNFIVERLKLNKDTKVESFYYGIYNRKTHETEGYPYEIDVIRAINDNWEDYAEYSPKVDFMKLDSKRRFDELMGIYDELSRTYDDRDKHTKVVDKLLEFSKKYISSVSYTKKEIRKLAKS